jgi:hypothetical protein
MTHEAGKGDTQRPTDHEKFSSNFEAIFGSKPKKELRDRIGMMPIEDCYKVFGTKPEEKK